MADRTNPPDPIENNDATGEATGESAGTSSTDGDDFEDVSSEIDAEENQGGVDDAPRESRKGPPPLPPSSLPKLSFTPMATRRGNVIVWSVAGFMVLVGVSLTILAALKRSPSDRETPGATTSASSTSVPSQTAASSQSAAASSSPGLRAPLPPITPSEAEASDVYPEAEKLARSIHADAKLVAIDVTGRLRNGVADLSAGGVMLFVFEFGPPGSGESSSGQIHVDVKASGLEARAFHFPVVGKTLSPPKCKTRDIWQEAVKSGVPADSLVAMHYGLTGTASTWELEVPDRPSPPVVDGVTCKIVSK